MEESDPRAVLDRLIAERGGDYSGLSRLLGRNPAYIQQYIKRGTPRRLAEEDRRKLAEFFDVEEALLGAPVGSREMRGGEEGLVPVRRYDVSASAGPGATAQDDRALSRVAFPERWLRRLAGDPESLSIIAVRGDSMEPTLSEGDEILVDRGDAGERLRDGIYVLRADDALVVKRIAINPANRMLTIRSDNPGYRDWPDCRPGDIEVIGRVVWAGRRVA